MTMVALITVRLWIRLWETQTAAFMFQTIQSSTTSSQTMTSLKGSSPGTQIRVMGLNYSVAAVVGVSGQVQGSTEVIAALKLEQKGSVTQYMRVGNQVGTILIWVINAEPSVGKGKQNKLEGTFSLPTMPDRVVPNLVMKSVFIGNVDSSKSKITAWIKIGPGANGPQNVNITVSVDNNLFNGGQVEINDDRWHELAAPSESRSNHPSNNISMRGHCIFWDVDGTVQTLIKALNKEELMKAVQNRLTGLLTRYKGKFKHYDVNNEMLHGSFYTDRLGKDIRPYMFKMANQLNPSATLFVMTITLKMDVIPGSPVGGIGIQGHIDSPVGPVACSALDNLGILGLPIWFTELDVSSVNEYIRADGLEVMLREAYAHPLVGGRGDS
ncbi:Endo-1,4-beta-xylanase 1 [Linum perenne]